MYYFCFLKAQKYVLRVETFTLNLVYSCKIDKRIYFIDEVLLKSGTEEHASPNIIVFATGFNLLVIII